MKRIWVLWLGLVVGLVMAAGFPLTLKDYTGTAVSLKSSPKRIVTMLPSATVDLCAIGDCSELVGVDNYSTYPPSVNKLPKLGGLYNPDIEKIVALKPDLIIASRYGKLAGTLRGLGLKAFVVPTGGTYAEIYATLRQLGVLTGHTTQAESVISTLELDAFRLRAFAQDQKVHPTVYYEIDPTPYAAGQTGFIGELIRMAGGKNIIPASLGAFPKINPELVIEKNPQVIVLADAPRVNLASLKARPGWLQIAAVRNGRECELSQTEDDVLSQPAARVMQGLITLIHCFYPAANPPVLTPLPNFADVAVSR